MSEQKKLMEALKHSAGVIEANNKTIGSLCKILDRILGIEKAQPQVKPKITIGELDKILGEFVAVQNSGSWAEAVNEVVDQLKSKGIEVAGK